MWPSISLRVSGFVRRSEQFSLVPILPDVKCRMAMRSWTHRYRVWMCFSLPTPRREEKPRAAEEPETTLTVDATFQSSRIPLIPSPVQAPTLMA
eukprot:1985111-Pyramimonas_sp.AAC.1